MREGPSCARCLQNFRMEKIIGHIVAKFFNSIQKMSGKIGTKGEIAQLTKLLRDASKEMHENQNAYSGIYSCILTQKTV